MTDSPVSADDLFETCTAGNLESLEELLQHGVYTAKALETENRVQGEIIQVTRPELNLRLMLEKAARSGSAPMVKYLLAFAKAHGVLYEALLYPSCICAAIDSNNNVAVFKELLTVKPDIIDRDMGHVGTPLTQAVHDSRNAPLYSGDRIALVQFLLENGADPNGIHKPHFYGPGEYLESAVKQSSMEMIKLLLQHGAQIKQSGALHRAAEQSRTDIMDLLLKHGADVNEPLWQNDPMFSSRSRTNLKKNSGILSDVSDERRPKWTHETPLHFSVLYRQVEATAWLLEHGADADLEDSKGWSAREMAVKMGDQEILDVLERFSATMK